MSKLKAGVTYSSSDAPSLHFPNNKAGYQMAKDYERDCARLRANYLFRIYSFYGYYAGNQEKYVKNRKQLNCLETDSFDYFIQWMEENGYYLPKEDICTN